MEKERRTPTACFWFAGMSVVQLELMIRGITKADEDDKERGYVGDLNSRLGMDCVCLKRLWLREVISGELFHRYNLKKTIEEVK